MKRIILSALAALLFCAAQAMPAYPGLIQAKQPDGRIVSLYLHEGVKKAAHYLAPANTEEGVIRVVDRLVG